MKLDRGIRALVHDEDGVTSIEYAFIAMLIALAVVAAVTDIGTSLDEAYEDISNAFPSF